MIRIEMLNAERGDAILLSYGPGDTPEHHVLVDGGPANSGHYDALRRRVMNLPTAPDGRRHFDLLVVTHVDADHIEGIIRLLQDPELRCSFDDIWFNGWRHLEDVDPAGTAATLGPAQGEFLGALLQRQGQPWNRYLRGGAVVVRDLGPLPACELRGGLQLTLLSPTFAKLEDLATTWGSAVQQAGFNPGDAGAAYAQLTGTWWAKPPEELGDGVTPAADHSEANGSSIAFLAEYRGRAALFAADAHDDVLTATLRRLRAERELDGPLPLDVFKLPHHGSDKNTTEQLLAEVDAQHYLVSTNGKRFDHPDALAIKRVAARHTGGRKPIVCFNYRQPQTEPWVASATVEARFEEDAVVALPDLE